MAQTDLLNNDIFKTCLAEFYQKDNNYGCAYAGKNTLSSDETVNISSPINAKTFAHISMASASHVNTLLKYSSDAFKEWKKVPAPKRGELVRLYSLILRQHKHQLASIITLECAKPFQESLGEVQELIDVCDFAVGLSRQLHGLTISTERPDHRMMEQWLPIGPVVVISAFNFPMAVWGWNAALALVCGDSVIWKPSSQCPLSALACHQFLLQAIEQFNNESEFKASYHLSALIFGEKTLVTDLVSRREVALVSATGSCAMGRRVAEKVAARLGRSLLELGGNNAMIICPSANLELALRAIVFSAVGTSGQRCTSLRRLIVHDSLLKPLLKKLMTIYEQLSIGNPFNEANLLGPLINKQSVNTFLNSIEIAKQQGGVLLTGGRPIEGQLSDYYVSPAIMEIDGTANIVQDETFGPLLYVHSYDHLEQAIYMQNNVTQGLSSAIFTQNIAEAEYFLSAQGSDCGICNVNIGTSGAEIGGAFGGEKDTGGGRESGSDAWKNYMRRSTNTINYGDTLPLAQGINFDF